MNKSIYLFLFFVLFFSSCKNKEDNCKDISLEEGNITKQEEYDIVNTILEKKYSGDSDLLIIQKTQPSRSSDYFSGFIDLETYELDSTVFEEYNAHVSTSLYWKEDLISDDYEVMAQTELDCYFESGGKGWNAFYETRGEGFLQFQRPYLTEENRAIIEYGEYCGYLCAYGFLLILEKENGEWIIKLDQLTWIS
ncbi:MAG: hypothetical protein AB8F74_11715 [Saprospiraceae bacterium]